MTVLRSYVAGRWYAPSGASLGRGTPVRDAVTGETVAEVSSAGIDFGAALDYGRSVGGPALRAMTFHERAALAKAAGGLLREHRDELGIEGDGHERADRQAGGPVVGQDREECDVEGDSRRASWPVHHTRGSDQRPAARLSQGLVTLCTLRWVCRRRTASCAATTNLGLCKHLLQRLRARFEQPHESHSLEGRTEKERESFT